MDGISVTASLGGALQVFKTRVNRVSVLLEKPLSQESENWIEVVREMMGFGRLCVIMDVEHNTTLFRDRLVTLSVAGVDEVQLIGKTKSIVEDCFFLAKEINHRERLGLRILS